MPPPSEKELLQIGEWLGGERRYKLLDCDRKDILRLPSGAVHVWLALWMHSSMDEEIYVSLTALENATGLDRKTIIKWRDWLLEKGWLLQLEGSAAERYSKPSPGSSQVLIYRVNDPKVEIFHQWRTSTTGNIPPKVYISGSGLPGSFSEDTNPTLHSLVDDLSEGSFLPKEKNRENQTPKNPSVPVPCETSVPTQTKAEGVQAPAARPLPPQAAAEPVKPRLKKSPHKYDAPFPPDFDADKSPTGVKYRREWIAKHLLPPDKLKELAAESTESSPTATHSQDATAPSALWLAQELFRTVKQIPGVYLPVAAANWETKWPDDFERLLKTYTRDELTDIIKVSQIRNVPAYAAHEIADEVADLHKIAQERKTGKYGWERVEDLYQEKYGERRD